MTGQRWLINHYIAANQSSGYDGDGTKVKDVTDGVTTYYLTSTVLGGVTIEELNANGQKNAGYVYTSGGKLLATQSGNIVSWNHLTPAGTTRISTYSNISGTSRVELDPLGQILISMVRQLLIRVVEAVTLAQVISVD